MYVHRSALASRGYYDNSRRISQTDDGDCFALPITSAAVDQLTTPNTAGSNHQPHETLPPLPNDSSSYTVFNGASYILTVVDLPLSKKSVASASNSHEVLKTSVQRLLSKWKESSLDDKERNELLSELPTSWERHGDLVVLPARTFIYPEWRRIIIDDSHLVWRTVAEGLRCKRLARDSEIAPDKYRSSGAELLLGSDPWVEHVDNGVKYVFDVTRIMFSSGNITEKLRIAQFDCHDETVVDLFAGVGYFTLPYLVHARARVVHACEWNEAAVEGLRRGLAANGVEERCVVHVGDCREVCPRGLADRVNLGLVPSSEVGWPAACAALRPDRGGWLHIHGNVRCKPGEDFRVPRNPWEEEEREDRRERERKKVVETDEGDEGERRLSEEERGKKLEEDEGDDGERFGEEERGKEDVTIPGGSEIKRNRKIQSDYARALAMQSTGNGLTVNECYINPMLQEKASPLGSEPNSRVAEEAVQRSRSSGDATNVPELRRAARHYWEEYIVQRIGRLLLQGNPLGEGRRWEVRVGGMECVKSYAPCVDHLVADVECRPIPNI